MIGGRGFCIGLPEDRILGVEILGHEMSCVVSPHAGRADRFLHLPDATAGLAEILAILAVFRFMPPALKLEGQRPRCPGRCQRDLGQKWDYDNLIDVASVARRMRLVTAASADRIVQPP